MNTFTDSGIMLRLMELLPLYIKLGKILIALNLISTALFLYGYNTDEEIKNKYKKGQQEANEAK